MVAQIQQPPTTPTNTYRDASVCVYVCMYVCVTHTQTHTGPQQLRAGSHSARGPRRGVCVCVCVCVWCVCVCRPHTHTHASTPARGAVSLTEGCTQRGVCVCVCVCVWCVCVCVCGV